MVKMYKNNFEKTENTFLQLKRQHSYCQNKIVGVQNE